MKKYMVIVAGLCLSVALVSCGSKESAYRKAYEAAQSSQAADVVSTPVPETPVVTPVVTQPANQSPVVDNLDNVTVRQERVTVVSGNGLKNFSVVVGAFGVIENAQALQQKLRAAGYDAQIVKNEERTPVLYRVVAATFADKASSVVCRDQLRAQYPDAWLLYNVK